MTRIITGEMMRSCCSCVLSRQKGFMEQRLGIEESYAKFIQENDTFYRCLFLPMFHPELVNYIERIQGRSIIFGCRIVKIPLTQCALILLNREGPPTYR
jgi:hypothetical protein